jgi:secretion/DNA translocation related TadE-like protein
MVTSRWSRWSRYGPSVLLDHWEAEAVASRWSRYGPSTLLDEREGAGLLDERGGARLLEEREGEWSAERGAGAALALAIATAALLLAMLVVGAGTASIAQARAAAAADAAALAAADALSGYADGAPCGLAHAVVAASGVRLEHCALRGLEASVTATIPLGPWHASATARAGPPP